MCCRNTVMYIIVHYICFMTSTSIDHSPSLKPCLHQSQRRTIKRIKKRKPIAAISYKLQRPCGCRTTAVRQPYDSRTTAARYLAIRVSEILCQSQGFRAAAARQPCGSRTAALRPIATLVCEDPNQNLSCDSHNRSCGKTHDLTKSQADRKENVNEENFLRGAEAASLRRCDRTHGCRTISCNRPCDLNRKLLAAVERLM